MHKTLVAGIVGLSLLSGCMTSQEPVAEGYFYVANTATTNAEVNKRLLSCEVRGSQEVPANVLTSSTPVYSSPATCGPDFLGNMSCSGGYISGGTVSSYDVNEELRRKVIRQCWRESSLTATDAPPCPTKDQKKNRFDHGLSALDILVLEWANKTTQGITHPPKKYTCVEPGGDYSVTDNPNTNDLILFYKNWATMLDAEDEIAKQNYRKAYKETRSRFNVKSSVSGMELDMNLCTGKIDADGYLEAIRQSWKQEINLTQSKEEMEQIFNTKTLFQSVCEFGDVSKSLISGEMRGILKSPN